MSDEHIIKSFDFGLTGLDRAIRDMGDLIDREFLVAIDAFQYHDAGTGTRVGELNAEIYALNYKLKNLAVGLQAKQRLWGRDLRLVIVSPEVANCLSSISENVAKIARNFPPDREAPTIAAQQAIPEMALKAKDLVADILAAYLKRDERWATQIAVRGEELTGMNSGVRRSLILHMKEQPNHVSVGVQILSAGNNLEQIGVEIAKIADLFGFLVQGRQFPEADSRDLVSVR